MINKHSIAYDINLDPLLEEIHLWYIPLDFSDAKEELDILSVAEQQSASKFYFSKDRKNYRSRHIALRKILSKYCKVNAKEINFAITNYQKPYLQDNIHGLQFNMSSSNNLAILAITKKHAIGVDIEHIKLIDYFEDIVERFFTSTEKTKFFHLPENQKLEAFYSIWTKKEAFVKAVGNGLSYPLDLFEVSFTKNERPQIIQVNNSVTKAKKWTVKAGLFTVLNEHYITAVVTKSIPKKITHLDYPYSLSN